jgi:CheY-like chemotaxis protein
MLSLAGALWKWLRSHHIQGLIAPDAILLDVMMPKIDGFEVCRRLKGDPTLGFVPIIMVTARV